MRVVPRRFRALLSVPNRWTTIIEWSNDGGRTWATAPMIEGSVTCAATSQVRWTCNLNLRGVTIGRDGLNQASTRLRIWHGIEGLPLLAMGVYKISTTSRSSLSAEVSVTGESFERYVIKSRFPVTRRLAAAPARLTLEKLVREVIPNASFDWQVDGSTMLPAITEDRDRWSVIDGKRESGSSIARALAARVYTGSGGEWVIGPVPSLTDPIRWRASVGTTKITDQEELSDEELCNAIVVSGEADSNGNLPFKPRMAVDSDPNSITYAYRSPDDGGLGLWPIFYTSKLLTNAGQADPVARSMLAERLGFKQQIDFTQVHDPTIQPGDVGVVETSSGDRLVLPDSITYSLLGAPLVMQCRTTETTLAGQVQDAPDDSNLDSGSID